MVESIQEADIFSSARNGRELHRQALDRICNGRRVAKVVLRHLTQHGRLQSHFPARCGVNDYLHWLQSSAAQFLRV